MLVNIIGTVGMIVVLAGYYLVSTKKVSSKSSAYHLINLLGSLILAVYTVMLHAWPAVVLNLIWSVIAVSSIFSNKKESKT